RDYAVAGGAAGAVVGATIGTIKGFESQADNQVKEVWQERQISHPELKGYHHRTVADVDRWCEKRDDDGHCTDWDSEIEGWWHRYSPNVRDRVVGNYTEPAFKNQNFLEPLSGAFLGALGGGVVGVLAGVGVAAIQNSLEDRKAPGDVSVERFEPESAKLVSDQALTHRMGGYAVAGTVLGAGVGAYLGVKAGGAEAAANEVNTRTWDVPVYQKETIGHIPDDYYEHNRFFQWGPENGRGRAETEPVRRNVPVYDSDGSPRMTKTSETFESKRYGKVLGGIAGGAIGAGVGLATGVTVGLADKILTQQILGDPTPEVGDPAKQLVV
ncbi:MAG: hypothetical protein KC800_27100, partial [Candidatus Eremiobacteraeota bacterium]|nr:hypothetical protein [Candidatus Eremiobacteraeota bacterium]